MNSLHERCAAVVDGTTTLEQFSELQALLRGNPEAQRFYVRYLDLHAALAHRHRAGRWKEQTNFAEQRAVAPRSSSVVLLRRYVPGGELSVGALLIFAVSAAFYGLYWQWSQPRPEHDRPAVAISNPVSTTPVSPSQPVVEAVVGKVDSSAGWKPSGDVSRETTEQSPESEPRELPVVMNRRLRLESGVAQLKLKDGVVLTVEGPAEVEPKYHGKMFLHSGKLVALVPPKAKGFVVQTSEATVIDQGTEFGVGVAENGETRVAVFRGVVDVAAWNADRATADASPAPPQRLYAGQSTTVSSKTKVVRAEDFDFEYTDEFLRSPSDTRVALAGPRPPRPVLVSGGKPVSSSANFTPTEDVGEVFPPANVVDGRWDDIGSSGNWSFWLAPDGVLAELVIDLQVVEQVTYVRLQNTHNRFHNDRGTKAFRLSLSTDGETYSTVAEGELRSVMELASLPFESFRLATPTAARYVKCEVLSHCQRGAGLNEIQVYALPRGTSANVSETH